MAAWTFNIAMGRVVEMYLRVDNNDPSTSALIAIPIAASGMESQATLQVADTFAAVVSGATNEATGTGWDRKTFTDSELATATPDDSAGRWALSLPSISWTPDAASPDLGAVVVCYDANTGSGTDSDLVPLVWTDFAFVTTGLGLTISTGVFCIATGRASGL